MLVFASRVQRTIPIPHDPPHTVTIQKLARRHAIAAAKSQQGQVVTDMRAMFGEDWQRKIRDFTPADGGDKSPSEKAPADPLLQYDVEALLTHGVKGWSYVDDHEQPIPVSAETIADLDVETAEFMAREVLRLTHPKLFDASERESEKNASASSGPA